MTFSERLAKQLEQAPSRVIQDLPKKAYNWECEANQKRSIR